MSTDKNLRDILDKILETELAIFHCHTNSLLKIPNRIISTRRVDEDGNIWFYIERPQQLLSQFEREFPVGLNYFKKGSTYSMKIFGKGRIIIDPEELNTLENFTTEEIERARCNQLLMKVKILKADVFVNDYERNNKLIKKVSGFFLSLFDWAKPTSPSFDYDANSSLHYSY